MPVRRTLSLLAAACLAGPCTMAMAGDSADMPATPAMGAASKIPAPPLGNVSGIGKGPGRTSPATIRKAIQTARSDQADVLRGTARPDPLRRLGRSVVLVVTPTQLGSATLIRRDGTFVTSWHIVRDEKTVGVIYMPPGQDQRPTEADAVQARVVRTDPRTDLALLKVHTPAPDIKPIPLASPAAAPRSGSQIQIMGHPYGEVWTYTLGTLRQLQKAQTWTSPDGTSHQADVVQFQTRSVTGNSGGPVLDRRNHLIGIDTVRRDDKVLLSLAVSSTEVTRLLDAPEHRESTRAAFMAPRAGAAAAKACEPSRLDTRRTRDDTGTVHVLDLNCNGHADAMLLVPDNAKLADHLASDANENGVTDAVYFDFDRDGHFDEVRFDTDEDGKADLVGSDLDDELVPTSVRVIAH